MATFLRRSYASPLSAHGVLVASWETSLRCYCVAVANPLHSHGTHSDRRGNAEPWRALCACTKCMLWHGVLGDPTASSGDATAMPRRSLGALGDLIVRTSAFWVFLARRAVAVRRPHWCDRGLSNIKLYVSFHHHMWIKTGITVRKRLSWVVTSVTLTSDLDLLHGHHLGHW